MCLGVALRLKKEERSLSLGYLLAAFVGGVTEPGLYGIGMRYKKPFLGLMAGGFAGALYGAIMGVTAYNLVPVASFLALTAFIGGTTANLVNGILTGVIAFVVAALVTYFLDFKRDAEATKIFE
jgi:PTS system beta-glucosides-specific IIC component